jgi:N-acetylglutamate synthase-like GNAT family acetyltransferase
MKVLALQVGDPRWEEVAQFADHCSWIAGPRLAQKMRVGDFKSWERVFIAEHEGLIAGFCTLTEKDCLPDVDYAPFIGFVFVAEPFRGKRISQALILDAANLARQLHFQTVYIATREQGLYEKYGFVAFDQKNDLWGEAELFLKYDLDNLGRSIPEL